MDRVTLRLETLGREVARVSDVGASPDATLSRVKQRLQGKVAERQRVPFWWRPRVMLPVGAVAMLAVALALVTLELRRGAPSSVQWSIAGRAAQGSDGGFVEARDKPVQLRFTEGTRVDVLPGSGLHVLEEDPQRVALVLERGSVHLAVTSGSGIRWSVRAGPFVVRVTGTRFDIRWQPEARRFQLDLSEGSVEVSGPHLPRGRRIVAGERLVVHVESGEMTISRTAEASQASTELAPAQGGECAPNMPAPSTAASSGPSSPPSADSCSSPKAPAQTPSATASWQRLAQTGKYRAAMALVLAEGFARVLARSSASDVRLLVDTARFAHRPRLAQQALGTLRNKHGARGQSAFLLGKIAADQLGARAEALKWFEAYLREAPNGALREQALGRSLELVRHGDPARARRAARRYLAEYPGGAYAALAKKVVAARESPKGP